MRFALSTALAAVVAMLAFALPAHASPHGGVAAGSSTTSSGGNLGGGSAYSGASESNSGGSASTGGGAAPSSAHTTTGGSTPVGGASFDPAWVPSGSGGRGGAAPVSPAPSTTPTTPTTGDPGPGSFARLDIPAAYLTLYKQAAKKYRVNWMLLAAIGKNETDHGRAVLPGVFSGLNHANCCAGPMQICAIDSCGNVWQYYAIDAGGDGVASVYDPADAIDAAAHLASDLKGSVGNNSRLMLAAYNAGPGNVQKYRGIPPFSETQKYVRAAVRYMRLLKK